MGEAIAHKSAAAVNRREFFTLVLLDELPSSAP